jgi:hypothetical protein
MYGENMGEISIKTLTDGTGRDRHCGGTSGGTRKDSIGGREEERKREREREWK